MDKNDEKFKIELCIGNDGFFTIDFTKKSDDKEEDFYKLDFKYKRPAGLDNAIYALEFFVKFLESDKLILNQAEINLSDLDLSSIEGFSYKDERDILIGFRTILNKFDISYEDLDLNNLDKNELHNLEMIYQSLFLNELVKFPEALTALFITSKIGPISLLLYAVGQPEKNTYRLLDAYGHLCWAGVSHIKNPSQSEIKATPSFSIVDKDIILKSTNLTIDALDNLLNELKNSDRTFDLGWLNNFGMELIKTYDESSTIDYLKMAQKVFRWLINEEEQNYYKINYYQAKKREGNLKEEDINYLEKILENAEESLQKTTNNFSTNQLKNHKSDLLKPSVKKSAEIQTIFGCQVLLEDNYSARKTFELFPDDLQKEYEDHPIYKLFKTK